MAFVTGTTGQLDHTSPETSSYHRSLRSAVRKASQNEDVLREILWLLNASDYILDIRRISANLLRLLPALREITAQSCKKYEFNYELFAGWEVVLEWIRDHLPAGVCPEEGGDSNPYYGNSFQRNPLWVDLWENVESVGYRTLQAQFVFAHVRYLYSSSIGHSGFGQLSYERYDKNNLWGAMPKSTYDAALRIRQLAELPDWSSLLGKLPQSRPAFAYQEALSGIEFSADARWGTDYRETIRSFLARANGFEEWSERDSTKMIKRSRRPPMKTLATENLTPGDPDDEFTRGWSAGSVVTIAPQLPKDFVREAIAAGCDPGEFADQTEFYVATPATFVAAPPPSAASKALPPMPSTDAQRLAIRRAIAVRGQYRHIQMQHQLLPFEYNIPAAQEMHSLQMRLDSTWHDLGHSHRWDLEKRRTAEMITLIKIQMWFGVSLKRAQGLVVVFTTEGQPEPTKDVAEGKLIYDLTTGDWALPIDMPPYRSVVPDPAKQAHRQLKWLPLQDPANVGLHVKALRENAREVNRRSGSSVAGSPLLFPMDEKSYELAIREFLRADDTTCRITLRRLGGFLLNRMVSLRADLMAGALVTGRLGTLTRTERFYASYSVENLRELYFRATSKMLEQVTGRAANKRPLRHPEIWNGHVGARLCAYDTQVKNAIRRMQDGIDSTRNVKRDRVRFHNLMTLYSVVMFCFCTSCRPVRVPFLRRQRIDEETGFAYLADKDDDAHHKLRLIWVPDLCQEQMHKYEEHCARLALHHAEIRDWPDPCFLLKKNREPMRVRLGKLPADLQPLLPLQPNFYRIYLRHRLLEAHTPPEIVMAWLGHAFAGEEIWNGYSAMSAMDYRACIRNYLMPILEKDLKWRVM